jgi:asparagine synthetase B (glutamine-hydrolysing)
MLDLGILAVNAAAGADKLNKLRSFLGPREPQWRVYLKLFSYMYRQQGERLPHLDQFAGLAECFGYRDTVTNALNFDTQHYLSECLLTKEDRASMAVSLEARVPFLDHTLVDFAATLPTRLKIKGGERKAVLKKAFRGILPDEILFRRKQGFGVPLADYLRDELKDFAEKELFGPPTIELYDRDLLARAWRRHQQARADYSRLFWTIIMFNLWHRRWMA